MNNLDVSIETTHEVLFERLRLASSGVTDAVGPRDVQQLTNSFLASTCRHMCAVNAVLVPAARDWLPDGAQRSRDFLRHCRRLEIVLGRAKAKVYGEAHAIQRPWATVWSDVRREFEATVRLERELVDALLARIDVRASDALADLLYKTEAKAPTRPHPYLPHRGLAAAVARRLWARADRLWDTVEGRTTPEPVATRPPAPQGLMAQYLMGNPRLDVDLADAS